jgi:hypothetical protein
MYHIAAALSGLDMGRDLLETSLLALNIISAVGIAFSLWAGALGHLAAYTSIFFLVVIQLDFAYATSAKSLFVYSFKEFDLALTSCSYLLCEVALLISLRHISRRKRTDFSDKAHQTSRSSRIIMSTVTVVLSTLALALVQQSTESGDALSGRGTFQGVGIVMSALLTVNVYLAKARPGIAGWSSIAYSLAITLFMSRIFFIVTLVSAFAERLRSMSSQKRLALAVMLSAVLVLAFVYTGELKDKMGQGYEFWEALASLPEFNFFSPSNSNNSRSLGFELTYTVGIEVASSVSNCYAKLADYNYPSNIASLYNSLIGGLFPSILGSVTKPLLLLDANRADCANSIVQPSLQELLKAFDLLGVILYAALLCCVCFLIDQAALLGGRLSLASSLYLFLPIFLVRGTLGLCISIGLGVLVSSKVILKINKIISGYR